MSTNNIMTNEELNNRLQTLSTLLSRAQLASRMGTQYGGDRDVYKALGYPETEITYQMYKDQYDRHDMAKAIINRPVQATWHGHLRLAQSDDKGERSSAFQKAWDELCLEQQLKERFIRLDKLASLGKYGALLLGFDDVRSTQDMKNPVNTRSKRELLYIKPLSEVSAKISKWDDNAASPRYGQPVMYDVSITIANNTYFSTQVHYTRMLHIPGELLEDETYGVPVLQAVFNRLYDLDKLIGASAEMFWRGARPGFQGKVDKDFTLTDTAKLDLQAQLDEYENNLRRFLINEGISLEALQMQVADPKNHVDIQLQMISAVTGIPKRILVGSERGELASSEDRTSWLELVQTRRMDYAEAQIIRPFVSRCVEYGVLPKPTGSYKVLWSDIFAPSEKEHADIGKTRAAALQSYMNNPAAEIVVPPEVFFEYMLGLDEDDVQRVKELYEEYSNKNTREELAQITEAIKGQPAASGRPPATGSPAQEEAQEEIE